MKKSIAFIKGLLNKIGKEDSIAYAYKLTYGLLLSIFPFLIFLFTLIAYLGLDANAVLDVIRNALPEDIYEIISVTVVDLVNNKQGTLLSASVFLAIFTSSGGFRAFMKGVNQSMGLEDHRNILYRYLISIIWVLLLAITILLALVGIVFGRQILNVIISYIPQFPAEGLVDVLRLAIPVALLFFILAMAYMFIPSQNLKFKYAYPGAIFSTITWIIFTMAFQIYINNFANYSRFYGTLGALIGLLLWLNLTSIIMILGSSLNAYLIEFLDIDEPYILSRKEKKAQGEERILMENENMTISIPERKFNLLKDTFKMTIEEEEALDAKNEKIQELPRVSLEEKEPQE